MQSIPSTPQHLEISGSRQFVSWLAEQQVSLAFTTYQAGKLFQIGLKPDGQMSVSERTYNRCMGLCADDDGLWMSTLTQLYRFENTLDSGQDYQGYDKLYIPRRSYTTGDLDLQWPPPPAASWYSSTPCSVAWPSSAPDTASSRRGSPSSSPAWPRKTAATSTA